MAIENKETIEQPRQPEQVDELAAVEHFLEEERNEAARTPELKPASATENQPTGRRTARVVQPTPRPVTDEFTRRIEKILEQDLGDAYSRLSPLAQQEFKVRGEVTARKISILLRSTHLKVKKIFKLILAWLSLLPVINRFFLEQEAKIKTDHLIQLHKEKRL